jgi:broad specificity phosphatase PhoE
VVTGSNHGEAFGKLSVQEQDGEICSGFFDPETGKFCTDCGGFYTKNFILVRHGETQGGRDSSLCEVGKAQVTKLANHLLTQELNEFEGFVSPYQRCLETAAIISQITGIKFTINLDIREKVPQEEQIESHVDEFPQFNWPAFSKITWHFFPEEVPQFIQRVDTVAARLPKKSLLVSHCDFILNFLQEAIGDDITKSTNKMPYAGLSIVKDRTLLCVGKQFA